MVKNRILRWFRMDDMLPPEGVRVLFWGEQGDWDNDDGSWTPGKVPLDYDSPYRCEMGYLGGIANKHIWFDNDLTRYHFRPLWWARVEGPYRPGEEVQWVSRRGEPL